MDELQQVFNETQDKVNFFTERFTMNTLKYIAIAIGVFIFFLLLRKIFTKYVLNALLKLTSKTKGSLDKKLILAFQGPIRGLFIVVGAFFALLFLSKGLGYNIYKVKWIIKIFKSINIILISKACYNLTTEHSVLYKELSDMFNIRLDRIIFPFISKVFQAIIIALSISVVFAIWDYNINGFVAGLGVGGAAMALAAKDTIANIFGGVVIILDKPFSIGDYIKTSNVEGIVEDITIRSTRIRTIDKALVTEPNASLSNSAVINWTKRDMRRINFVLGVTYNSTQDSLKICVDKIRDMLIDDHDIHNDNILVYFDSFGPSSLDISITCFANTVDLEEFMKIKQNVNLKIMGILEEEGVSLAFPSTSVYFESHLVNKNIDTTPDLKENI